MSEKQAGLKTRVRTQRDDFVKGTLNEADVPGDPFVLFSCWLDAAFEKGNACANAMALSTVNGDGMPSSRIVLLRDISNGGFTFFTNYQSRKAQELRSNNKASLLFFWPESERQVRVQGETEFLPEEESDAYFNSRPFENKVGAWASAQSAVIGSRLQLDKLYLNALELYRDKNVPRPLHWGGYVLKPDLFEFWQGGAGRLHDRLQYRPDREQKSWVLERLMP